jgi:hypothetical protein
MITASQRAEELNAEMKKWIDSAPDRGGMMLVTDASHWAEDGIHTGADLDAYLAFCDYEEAYKELNGIKPRWLKWSDNDALGWGQELLELIGGTWED